MPNSLYIFDASADNFQRLVLENSAKEFELLREEDERVIHYRGLLQASMH